MSRFVVNYVLNTKMKSEFSGQIGGREKICLYDNCKKYAISGLSICIEHGATDTWFVLFPSDLHIVTDNVLCQLISARCEHDRRRAQCNECGGR